MPRKTAMLISGVVTAFVLMVVLGLAYGANRFSAAAATSAPAAAGTLARSALPATSNTNANSAANAAQTQQLQAEVQQLQQQVQAYKEQLQQSYTDLQAAYDQIQQMNNQQAGGGRRFRGDRQGSSLFGESFEGSFDER